MKFTSKFSNSESTNTIIVVFHKPSVVWGISHLAGNELVLYPFPWWRYYEYSSSTWVEVFAKLRTGVKLKISALVNLIEISRMIVNLCRAERTHRWKDPQMAHAWKQHVCTQIGKEKKGGLKNKEPFWFLQVKIQSQTYWKTNWERRLSICPRPVESLPWPQGLRDLCPMDSLDLWREFHFMFSGKQQNKLLWSFLKGVMKG